MILILTSYKNTFQDILKRKYGTAFAEYYEREGYLFSTKSRLSEENSLIVRT